MAGARHMSGFASMTLSDCARQLGAALFLPNSNQGAAFDGVSTDSRRILPGELFVAIKGENFDGHQYVAGALARGAAAAVVAKIQDVPIAQIVVGDTLWAYAQLAQFWRSRFSLPVIALTGSNGKTTVKEMLRAILAAHCGDSNSVLATEGNLNNHIGVPQMLLRLNTHHRYAVLEMGMNHLHEIEYLTRLAVPNVALLIMAGTAHIGELGSREAIAQAKGEIFAGLRDDGIACINADDPFSGYWHGLVGTESNRRVVAFGVHAKADVRGQLLDDGCMLFADGKSVRVKLNVMGEHNQRNALAAAAAAYAVGVPLAMIQHGLQTFTGVDGRLRTYAGLESCTVIDDTYNANPDSMRAAIAVLAAKKGKRLLVLGDMGELGADSESMHTEVGRAAKAAGIDALHAVGESAKNYVAAFGAGASHHASVEALIAALKNQISHDTTVLVKGSRFMKMERVVEKIAPDYRKGNH